MYVYLLLYVLILFSFFLTDIFGRRSSSLDIVSRLLAGPFKIQNLVTVTNVSILQNLQTGSGLNPASYSVGTGVHFRSRATGASS